MTADLRVDCGVPPACSSQGSASVLAFGSHPQLLNPTFCRSCAQAMLSGAAPLVAAVPAGPLGSSLANGTMVINTVRHATTRRVQNTHTTQGVTRHAHTHGTARCAGLFLRSAAPTQRSRPKPLLPPTAPGAQVAIVVYWCCHEQPNRLVLPSRSETAPASLPTRSTSCPSRSTPSPRRCRSRSAPRC